METIKKYWSLAAGVMVALFVGIIYALQQRVNGLKSKNEALTGEQELGHILGDYEDAKKEAQAAEDAYYHARRELMSKPSDEDAGS